jgi:molecular chaperone HtpG
MTKQDSTEKNSDSETEFGFQAEVARLLHLMVHSVYSEKEIVLRE